MTNLKSILKIYALERDLNPDDLALLNTLRTLTESEREVMVEALQPGKAKSGTSATGATTKRKIEHCGVCDFTRRAAHHKDVNHKDYHEFHARTERPGKSLRASSLQQRIQSSAKGRPVSVDDGDDKFDADNPADLPRPCAAVVDDNGVEMVCGLFPDANIHHLTSDEAYHEFQPPVRSAGVGGAAV